MRQLKDNIWYVGVQNPGLRKFDIIMTTEFGTSYNSYLVKGEKYALIEAAHEDYADEFIENIREFTPVEAIDYIILNHTEPDHSGNLTRILELNPDIQVIGSTAAIKNLKAITNLEFNSRAVKDKEELDLGAGMVLEFIIAPNLHWPDSMFTYEKKEGVLFSCDFFGAHYSEPMILDSHIKYMDAFVAEQKNYFDCIFGPFKPFVTAGLKKLDGREISMICNSHGPVLVQEIESTIGRYAHWAELDQVNKDAAVFYASAYGYTKEMAEALAEGVREAGVETRVFDVAENDMGVLAEAMNEADAVLFGSCTINRAAVPPVVSLITMTDAVNLKNKPAMVFGSYGWSGEACKQISDVLNAYKYKVYNDGVKVCFKPVEEELVMLRQTGKEFGQAI